MIEKNYKLKNNTSQLNESFQYDLQCLSMAALNIAFMIHFIQAYER